MKHINCNPLALILGALILVAASFYVGHIYGTPLSENARPQGTGQFGGNRGQGMNRNGGMRMMPTTGKVLHKDATSITVSLPDGGSRIIIIDAKTAVTHTSDASLADVTEGTDVNVFGTQNPDGSITASRIETGTFSRMPQHKEGGAPHL